MTTDEQPPVPRDEPPQARSGGSPVNARRAAAMAGAGLAGSAVLGLLCGVLWGETAPRALLREIHPGEAAIVNAETRAFIGADAYFVVIAAVAGLLTGVLGYLFLVSRYGGQGSGGRDPGGPDHGGRAATAAGLILGALAGAAIMMWLGEQIGLSGYDHTLATSAKGTMFDASLSLGAKSALAFWPLLTSAVILFAEWRARRAEPAPPPPAPAVPGPFGYPSEG